MPLMQLKMLVLPAPLGPMMAKKSPALISRLTQARAATPPRYYIAEIDIKAMDAYTKEYVPRAQAGIKAAGGRLVAAGSKTTAFEGAPPKSRVAVQVWDSVEKIKAWRNSAEFKEARKIGDKYAKFRSFAVEGIPQ